MMSFGPGGVPPNVEPCADINWSAAARRVFRVGGGGAPTSEVGGGGAKMKSAAAAFGGV
jgi:hypothetical protein